MQRKKTPVQFSIRSTSVNVDKAALGKVDFDPKSMEKSKYQTLDRFTQMTKKPVGACKSRGTTRPSTEALSKDYKIRTVYKSKTPYTQEKSRACAACKSLLCRCKSTRQFAEIDSEPDDVLSLDKLKESGSKVVLLLKGLYPWRPATVLFDYPEQCRRASRVSSRVFSMKEDEIPLKPLYFKVSDSAVSYNCFVNAFVHAGFEETHKDNYNLLISGVPKPDFLRELDPNQKINHFPGIWQLGRKDNLWRNMLKMRRKHGKAFEYCPYTYLLPEDFNRLQSDREENPKALWILKPAALSCGRGIKVISHKSKLSSKKTGYIVSKYLSNPHLLNGFKYDLRVYVGVNSFDPLRVFMYKEGLVRFATEKYSVDSKSLKKRYVHLTNFSVNKNSSKFVKNTDSALDGQGSKWSFKALRAKYSELGIDYDSVFKKIEDIVVKTMISVEPHVVNSLNQGSKSRLNCFETYGFDVLIDSNLNPWLLEVNVCPSLASSSPLDKQIKTSLMCDIFTLANIVPYDRALYEKEVEFQKSNRLYGIEKQPRLGHRNLGVLNSCENLENYSFSSEDLEMLADCEEDTEKLGDFKPIFPVKETLDQYSAYFDVVRYNNTLLWKHLKSPVNVLKHLEITY